LLDPGWERAAGSARIEQKLKIQYKEFRPNLTDKESKTHRAAKVTKAGTSGKRSARRRTPYIPHVWMLPYCQALPLALGQTR
jgi:hypothetical protein